MVSRIFKGTAALVATLSLASAASAGCGNGLYCGDATAGTQSLSSWSGQSGSSWVDQAATTYGSSSSSSAYVPSESYASSAYAPSQSYSSSSWAPSESSYSSTMSSYEADSTYGTGSISEAYSAAPRSTYSSYGSTASCPTGTQASTSEGQIIGCYNISKPVATTTYQRVVRPVVYVRYPVPVAVPYTSPCHTVKYYSRYGGLNTNTGRRSCGGY